MDALLKLLVAVGPIILPACAEETMSDCTLRELASWDTPEKKTVEVDGQYYTTERWNCGLKIAMWLCDEDVDLSGCEPAADTGVP
jgi:hypothetical protein